MSSHDRILPVQPLTFLDQEAVIEAGDEIIIPEPMMNQWMDLFVPGTPMLARLTNLENDMSRVVCIGSSDKSDKIYVPTWIMQHLGYTFESVEEQLVYISPFTEEIPAATTISLRPMDNAIYHSDLVGAIEKYLDRFHVMEAGTTICIPLEELGGFEICTVVESVEPYGIVRLGGEVHLEMLEPVGGIPEHEQVVEPVAEPVAEAPVVEEEVIPVSAVSEQVNQVITTEDHRAKMREAWAKRSVNINNT